MTIVSYRNATVVTKKRHTTLLYKSQTEKTNEIGNIRTLLNFFYLKLLTLTPYLL